MYRLTVADTNTTHHIDFIEKILLSDAIQKLKIDFDFPCSGNQTCGKCLVFASGALSKPDANEQLFAHALGMRLACHTWAVGDAQIRIPEKPLNDSILSLGTMRFFETSINDDDNFGIAIDIGTTTIVAGLFKPNASEPIAIVSERNRQNKYGADVISRISYSMEHGLKQLQDTTLQQLTDMVLKVLSQANRQASDISQIVVAGNTTMLHILIGLDPQSLSFFPFATQSNFGYSISANSLFPIFKNHCNLYLPPCISAFIGADITCAILAASLYGGIDDSLLVDIGTNGEMAYYKNHLLFCCSCAAGPAFEGAGLSMGMTASSGAISSVSIRNNTFEYETISNSAPAGICGSGVISCIANMLNAGVLDETGRIKNAGHSFVSLIAEKNGQPIFFIGNSGVSLSQQDVRGIQLAKSAISAGIDTLLEECKSTSVDVQRFVLCGGFGSTLNKHDASAIGLYPNDFVDKTQIAGNAAFYGAASLLFSKIAQDEVHAIANAAVEISLSSNQFFMNRYVDGMSFQEEV